MQISIVTNLLLGIVFVYFNFLALEQGLDETFVVLAAFYAGITIAVNAIILYLFKD